MNKHSKFLIILTQQLIKEGKHDKASVINEDFDEFLELLESGELNFDYTFEGGMRPSNMNRGSGKQLCEIEGN